MRRSRFKYQVFISSTFSDLHAQRERVSWEVLKQRHIPAGMENFPATDDRGWRIIQRTIDDSDYYILLVAGRYGSIDASTGMSWTEREYHYAREKDIPVLAFIRKDSHISADDLDRGERGDKLAQFVEKLRDAHLYETWTTADDLVAKIGAALIRAIDDDEDDNRPRAGWIRGDAVPPNALEEIARLSQENSDLRARLESLASGRRARLALCDGSGEPVSSQIVLTNPKFVPRKNNNAGLARRLASRALTQINIFADKLDEECEKATWTAWLQYGISNTGTGVSRDVRAMFDFDGATGLVLPRRSLRPSAELRGMYDIYELQESLRHRVVWSKRIREKRRIAEQRIPSIGVGQREWLAPMGIVMRARPGNMSASVHMQYEITDEEGERIRDSVTIDLEVRGAKAVDRSELQDLRHDRMVEWPIDGTPGALKDTES